MYYIGSAINLKRRIGDHKSNLKYNRHDNSYLQLAWNKYGEDFFIFKVLELIEDKTKLIECEQCWINELKAFEYGYNLNPIASSRLGTKHTNEAKAKISAAKKGIKYSEEYKRNMSEVQKGKIKSEEWLANIKKAIFNSDKTFKNKRNIAKWPHEKGKRCSCEECLEKHRSYNKEKYHKRKSIANSIRI